MKAIVAEISALLEADRTTVYEYDPEQNMLRGLAVQGETDVMVGVPVGTASPAWWPRAGAPSISKTPTCTRPSTPSSTG
jgi:hypothetical protein